MACGLCKRCWEDELVPEASPATPKHVWLQVCSETVHQGWEFGGGGAGWAPVILLGWWMGCPLPKHGSLGRGGVWGSSVGVMWDESCSNAFSPLFSLLTDRQTKGKAPRALLVFLH